MDILKLNLERSSLVPEANLANLLPGWEAGALSEREKVGTTDYEMFRLPVLSTPWIPPSQLPYSCESGPAGGWQPFGTSDELS